MEEHGHKCDYQHITFNLFKPLSGNYKTVATNFNQRHVKTWSNMVRNRGEKLEEITCTNMVEHGHKMV